MKPACKSAQSSARFRAMLFSAFLFPLAAAAAAAAASVVANPLSVPPKPLVSKRDGTYVSDLGQCPKLVSRGAPTSVHELRPDQIQVVGAIGDSITAGCFAKGVQGVLGSHTFAEWRGVSFVGGGDPGAITIPNLFKTYSQNLTGASVGYNILPETCLTPLCGNGVLAWNSPVDKFNAALSGAKVGDLLHEVKDYLVPRMQAAGVGAAFKYISLQIGSNDLCGACYQAETGVGPSSAAAFEKGIRETLEYMRTNLPNTIVNILGVLKVSDIYYLTKGQSYCQLLGLPHFNIECRCALLGGRVGQSTRDLMDDLMNQYNDRLVRIVTEYQAANYSDFAVLWFPANVPLTSYPITALSKTDCFHPSEKTHALFAATLWNKMTAVQEEREEPVAWTGDLKFRCLEESDRFRTRALVS